MLKIVAAAAAVVVIAAGIVVLVPYFSSTTDTKCEAARQKIFYLEAALERFFRDSGRYPTLGEGLSVLLGTSTTARYLEKIPLDPWEKPFELVFDAYGKPRILSPEYQLSCGSSE